MNDLKNLQQGWNFMIQAFLSFDAMLVGSNLLKLYQGYTIYGLNFIIRFINVSGDFQRKIKIIYLNSFGLCKWPADFKIILETLYMNNFSTLDYSLDWDFHPNTIILIARNQDSVKV